MTTLEDVAFLTEARNINEVSSFIELEANIFEGYLFCKENNFFYKMLEDGSIIIKTPCVYGFEIEPYVNILLKLIGDEIHVFFLEDERLAIINYNSQEFLSLSHYYNISIDVVCGEIIGLKFDFFT